MAPLLPPPIVSNKPQCAQRYMGSYTKIVTLLPASITVVYV